MPAGNERDLRDVPQKVRSAITFHFVERMDDVIRLALHGPVVAAARNLALRAAVEEPQVRVAQPKSGRTRR
jgi:hypothetical protein